MEPQGRRELAQGEPPTADHARGCPGITRLRRRLSHRRWHRKPSHGAARSSREAPCASPMPGRTGDAASMPCSCGKGSRVPMATSTSRSLVRSPRRKLHPATWCSAHSNLAPCPLQSAKRLAGAKQAERAERRRTMMTPARLPQWDPDGVIRTYAWRAVADPGSSGAGDRAPWWTSWNEPDRAIDPLGVAQLRIAEFDDDDQVGQGGNAGIRPGIAAVTSSGVRGSSLSGSGSPSKRTRPRAEQPRSHRVQPRREQRSCCDTTR